MKRTVPKRGGDDSRAKADPGSSISVDGKPGASPRLSKQRQIRRLRGKLTWLGDLNELRKDH